MHTFIRPAALAAVTAVLCAAPAVRPVYLMPLPKEMTVDAGSVAVTGAFSVAVSGAGAGDARVQHAVPRLVARLARQTGIPIPAAAPVSEAEAVLLITVAEEDHGGPQKLGDNERYTLTVGGGHIKLAADAPLGVLRGMETLLQLVRQTAATPGGAPGFEIPNVSIQDEPRFAWRGLSLDVARHFIPPDGVKRTIDGLAAVKLNVLHWHLSDDEGMRVESKKFPKLQELGADGMYYTQDEIRAILAYAADRGIRVVPEFDIPGHATSFLAAYPELGPGPGPYHVIHDHEEKADAAMDPTKESTYEFLDAFLEEMTALFPAEYFHVGGDEVSSKQWLGVTHIKDFMAEHKMEKTSQLQAYFSKRVLAMVTKYGKHMVGWDEILNPDLPKTAVIQSWRGQQSLWSAAKDGYQGILSANLYLDLCYPAAYHYSIDPMKAPASPDGGPIGKKGPAPGTPADLTAEQAKLILGGEAATWEELVSADMLDSRLWPRLAAIAERFWSPESVTDVASMYRRLNATNGWLEWLGLTHRTNLVLMRQRLAAPYPPGPLEVLASVIEPTKGYSRHAQKYGIFSPLNRLSFAIPSESDTAREFRNAVDLYLAAPDAKRSALLRARLAFWAQAAKDVRPMLENQSVLRENLPVADGVAKLCEVGEEALSYLAEPATVPADWKKKAEAGIAPLVNRRIAEGDLLIQIAPGVQKLLAAVKSAAN